MSFASHGFVRFNWHSFAQLPVWRFLLWLSMFEGSYYDCLWCDDKGTWNKKISLAYHRWVEFCHYIYCFVQSGKAFTVKRNKHTHTHTHTHTHKQTNTHTSYYDKQFLSSRTRKNPVHLGSVMMSFSKNEKGWRFFVELISTNPQSISLKKVRVDMEDAIFTGFQIVIYNFLHLYGVRHLP